MGPFIDILSESLIGVWESTIDSGNLVEGSSVYVLFMEVSAEVLSEP